MSTTAIEWIKAADGHEIFTKTWSPAKSPVASIVFVHGLGEHVCRKRSKTLGSTGGYEKAIPDITEALARVKVEGVPLFLMGHSYGGGLVLNYDCIGPLRTKLSGVIASAPLVLASTPTRPHFLVVGFAGMISKVLPSLQIPINLPTRYISRDAEEVKKYDSDPLIHGYITTKGVYDMLTNGKMLLTSRYQEITKDVPLLICHGTADGLTEHDASKEFLDKVDVKDKEFKVWPEFYHELHNEPEDDRKEVIAYYIAWIKDRVLAPAANE
ncbi:hypothetical protein BG004_002556 [Podila humilis]|nr:hypothetical protein BG004_002556 [Podila humilis]